MAAHTQPGRRACTRPRANACCAFPILASNAETTRVSRAASDRRRSGRVVRGIVLALAVALRRQPRPLRCAPRDIPDRRALAALPNHPFSAKEAMFKEAAADARFCAHSLEAVAAGGVKLAFGRPQGNRTPGSARPIALNQSWPLVGRCEGRLRAGSDAVGRGVRVLSEQVETSSWAGTIRSGYRAMQRKPMWLVEVSIPSGWRAAGR
jgi:hypothetical protein